MCSLNVPLRKSIPLESITSEVRYEYVSTSLRSAKSTIACVFALSVCSKSGEFASIRNDDDPASDWLSQRSYRLNSASVAGTTGHAVNAPIPHHSMRSSGLEYEKPEAAGRSGS